MDSIFLLVPIVIIFIVCAVKFFFWAVNSGQYDDLETEGRRILFDDDLQDKDSLPDAEGSEQQQSANQHSSREP